MAVAADKAIPALHHTGRKADSSAANFSKKGQPWTETEHAAFVEGLKKLGKGNWRGISRVFVTTRTPTQVASHAQKHFMRIQGVTKRKSRFSSTESLEDMGGKSNSDGMCSPASSGSFEPTHASAATLLRTEAHSSHPSVRHRSIVGAAAPVLPPVGYYPQSGPLSLMYPYMAAGQLDGSTASSWTAFSAALDALPAATAIMCAQAAANMAVQCTAQYAQAAAAFGTCGGFAVSQQQEHPHQFQPPLHQPQQMPQQMRCEPLEPPHPNLFTCAMPTPAVGLPKPEAHRPTGGDIGWGHFLKELIRSSDAEERARGTAAAAAPCGHLPAIPALHSSTHSAFRSLHAQVMA